MLMTFHVIVHLSWQMVQASQEECLPFGGYHVGKSVLLGGVNDSLSLKCIFEHQEKSVGEPNHHQF